MNERKSLKKEVISILLFILLSLDLFKRESKMDLIQLSLLSPLDFSTKKSDVNTTNMSPVSYSLAPTSSTTETTTVVADKPKSTVTRPFKVSEKFIFFGFVSSRSN